MTTKRNTKTKQYRKIETFVWKQKVEAINQDI